MDGGLILELYSRDGVGTMISTDFYEGLRKARASDVSEVQALLRPLEKEGVLVKRSRHELEAIINDFIVIERENKVCLCVCVCSGANISVCRVDLMMFCPILMIASLGAIDPWLRDAALAGQHL